MNKQNSESLKPDIQEARKNNIVSYEIFTYEAFLDEGTIGKKRLKDIRE